MFAAQTVLQQYLISISVITGVLVNKNKTHMFNEVADIVQLDLVNSRTFKDL